MTPRPRKASDDAIFAAAQRAMSRLGPAELTLAAIAKEAGVTAAALVLRFGSKRDLLLTMTHRFTEGTSGFFDGLRQEHKSPLAALRYYAECMSHLAESPAALARNLAYLQIDLTDEAFRKHLVKQARATRAGLEALIREAVRMKELKPGTDARALARTVEAILSGSMMSWGFYRQGSARRWMRKDLELVLAPYLARGAR
jgi:AcrR family transcriptional regulator